MIRILVDSSSDYSVSEIQEKKMDFIPIHITIGEKTYADGYELDRDKFYELLQSTGEFPKTSQPSPQAFLDVFEDAKEKGDDLICILLSSKLSGTFQSAVLARSMAKYDRIHLIDSRSAACAIKFMADHACALRDQGASAKEIVQSVEALKSRVKILAALDTLEYLGRGGRISKTAAAIGDLAKVKPIITLSCEGSVEILGKCLGKNKAISALLKQIEAHGIDPAFPACPLYSCGTDNCTAFEKRLAKEGYAPGERLQIGSTIGTHIGPGAFGLVFVAP